MRFEVEERVELIRQVFADEPRIEALDAFPLNVPLLHPFVIATGRLDRVENVAVGEIVRGPQYPELLRA